MIFCLNHYLVCNVIIPQYTITTPDERLVHIRRPLKKTSKLKSTESQKFQSVLPNCNSHLHLAIEYQKYTNISYINIYNLYSRADVGQGQSNSNKTKENTKIHIKDIVDIEYISIAIDTIITYFPLSLKPSPVNSINIVGPTLVST